MSGNDRDPDLDLDALDAPDHVPYTPTRDPYENEIHPNSDVDWV